MVEEWDAPALRPVEHFRPFSGYCIRCKQLEPPDLAHLCDPCWRDLRDKAESYGGSDDEATERMRVYIAALYAN